MAAKPSASTTQNSAASFQRPPQIHLSDKILASSINLPQDAVIASTTFVPLPGHQNHPYNLELARRSILGRNGDATLLDSLLANVKIGRHSAIHIFAIVQPDRLPEMLVTLRDMKFEGLDSSGPLTFTPQDVYLASHASRSSSGSYTVNILDNSPSSIPRKTLQSIYCQFIAAIRNRLIDDIVRESAAGSPRLLRLQDGVLLGRQCKPSEWGAEWEHHAQTRALILCTFRILLLPSPARLIIHPLLSLTSSLPLGPLLPLPPGTPITLLPSGTPAYYLSTYTGPTSGLITQFNESLVGQGIAGWDKDIVTRQGKQPMGRDTASHPPVFIIAWVSVENKQGEEKGLPIVWPTCLCISSSLSNNGNGPRMLSYIPELPAELQPSPPPAARATSESGLASGLFSPSSGALTPFISALSPTVEHFPPQFTFDATSRATYHMSPSIASSPYSESLLAFRNLTVSRSKKVPQVAGEVGEYVDYVARERERERDRIRKERESQSHSSPKQSRRTPNTPTTIPTGTSSTGDLPATTITLAIPHSGAISASGTEPAAAHPPPHISIGNFYPSPPQTNPPVPLVAVSETSPEVVPATLPVSAQETPIETQLPPSSDPQTNSAASGMNSFGSFGNIDMSWSEPVQTTENDFLDMNMEFDLSMGFNMDMEPQSASANAAAVRDFRHVEMDLDEDFTEDDFSFFDSKPLKPSNSLASTLLSDASTAAALDPLASSGLGHWTPSLFGELGFSGPGPPQLSPTSKAFGINISPWNDGLTGRFGDTEPTPALSPPSPGRSPLSHGGPPTPDVQLDESTALSHNSDLKHGRSSFDPIPFAETHKLADGKYAIGKFAPHVSDDDQAATEEVPPQGWKSKYKAATDPRVGLVRKLIGVKRKSNHQNRRPSKMSTKEHEDWSTKYDTDGDGDVEDSEVDSQDGEVEEADSASVTTRASTPPPAYLPLGHSLLHTQFHHSQLLPLSSPLRPPSSVVAPANISAGPGATFVPTPVSPGAALGAANEMSKSLEAAALMIAKEVVDNGEWALCWFANVQATAHLQQAEAWHADIHFIAHLLSRLPNVQGPMELRDLFSLATPSTSPERVLQLTESPLITLAKGDTLVHIQPTAIAFWEKLGLGPKGGKKDVTAYALFQEADESHRSSVANWLRNLSSEYTDKHLGCHEPGQGSGPEKNGLLSIQYDSTFRKNLANIVANLPPVNHSLVFYVVAPIMLMTLSSQLCRQVLSAIKRALKTYSEAQVLFHFVPEHLIYGTINDPDDRFTILQRVCASVYNRLLRPVDRVMSRKFSEDGQRVRAYFQDTATTLARSSVHTKYSPTHCFDVVDYGTLLHVGYSISSCGKWILVACVDQRGEAYDTHLWLRHTPGEDGSPDDGAEANDMSPEAYVASKVWSFTSEFAKRANIEWRIVITKLGCLSEGELQAWSSHLEKTIESHTTHVSLLCAYTDTSYKFLPAQSTSPVKKPRQSRGTNASLFIDISANTYILYPQVVFPVIPPALLPNVSMVAEPAQDEDDLETPPIFPLSTSVLIRAPNDGGLASASMLQIHLLYTYEASDDSDDASEHQRRLMEDISRNMVDLTVLAKNRWMRVANPILPFHLAAVESMDRALTREEEPEEPTCSDS
ncbi:Mediator of RNA polymerase II transcription subunit 13 [Pleurotus pulmonarius]